MKVKKLISELKRNVIQEHENFLSVHRDNMKLYLRIEKLKRIIEKQKGYVK